MPDWLRIVVSVLGFHAVAKFGFFLLPYDWRRRQLDRQYAGKPTATAVSDLVSLLFVLVLSMLMFRFGVDAASFLGGLWIGATLIQLFFHRFHAEPSADRAATPPLSPIKRLSYAIQDAPAHAWREMAMFTTLVIIALAFAWR